MEIDFQYAMTDEQAKSRLELLGTYLANRHGIKVTWIDPQRAKFSGKYLVVRIEGELTMNGGKGTFKGEDPGFLWRGKAKDYIEKKLAKYLDPNEDPAQLPTTA